MRTPWLMAGLAALAAGALGCADRTHLSAAHSRSFQQAFSSQMADPAAAQKPRDIRGLDSQEAAVIARTYRRSLGKEEMGTEERRPVLIMTAPRTRGADDRYMPPPSVPPEGPRP